MSNKVKWYDSAIHSGFVFNRGDTAGNLLAALDLILRTGFNTQAVTSITRSGSIATVTTTGTHNYVHDQVIAISGAGEAAYNGEFSITVTSPTTFIYTVVGTPTTPATGTISAVAAPLGWNRPYSATNKAVYQSPNSASSQHLFRIDDTAATFTVTRGFMGANTSYTGCYMPPIELYSSMSGIDTGTLEGRGWLHRQNTTTAKRMVAVGDDTTVWFAIQSNSYGWFQVFGFGDYLPFNTASSFKPSFMAVRIHSTSNNMSFDQACILSSSPVLGVSGLQGGNPLDTAIILGRGSSGARGVVGIADSGSRISHGQPWMYAITRESTGYRTPGQGMELVSKRQVPGYEQPILLNQPWPLPTILGTLPGVWNSHWANTGVPVMYNTRQLFGATRKVMMVGIGHTSNGGAVTFDYTGPWR